MIVWEVAVNSSIESKVKVFLVAVEGFQVRTVESALPDESLVPS